MRSSIHRLPLLALIFVLTAAVPGPSQDKAKAPSPLEKVGADDVTETKGDYQVAHLNLEKAWNGEDLRLFLGIRSGNAVVAWLCNGKINGRNQLVWFDTNTITIAGDRVRGDLVGRWVSHGPITPLASIAFSLDGRVNSGKVTGEFRGTIKPAQKAEVKVQGDFSGSLRTEGELAKEQSFAKGQDWPSFFGPKFNMEGTASSNKLIESLTEARPVWRSEQFTPCSWGTAPDGRYINRSLMSGVTGGASTPIVVEGKVYLYFYRPAGPIPNEEKVKAEAEKLSSNSVEQKAYLDAHRTLADEIVVCLDAATGKTLWVAVFRMAGFNLQTHKWQGGNPTPILHDGTLYLQTYSGRILALDARTGRRRWEYGNKLGKSGFPRLTSAGPVLADGVMAFTVDSGSIGLDAKSGKELWRSPACGPLVRWSRKGKEYLIFGMDRFRAGKDVAQAQGACVDPATGKIVWTFPGTFSEINRFQIDGDFLVGDTFNRTSMKPWKATFVCYHLQPSGAKEAWRFADLPMERDENGLALSQGHAYVSTGAKMTYCVDLGSGKVLATTDKFLGHLNQVLQVADGRLFIFPENHHGHAWFYMLNADPKGFGPMGEPFYPPHPSTTAYSHHGLGFPIVDGRMFVRGQDGIYCYDLRKR